MEHEVSVFLALASPLMRARLRFTLAAAPGIRLEGEAATAEATATYLAEHQVEILLTERALLRGPALARPLAQRDAPRVVVATATDVLRAAQTVPEAARAVPFMLTPAQLAAELRRALVPDQSPEAPLVPPDLRDRFHITGPFDPHARAPQAPEPAPQRPPQPVPQLVPEPALRQVQGRRHEPTPGTRRLQAGMEPLRFRQRDALTGLAGPAALEHAQALLPSAKEPAAVMRLEVRDVGGRPLASPGDSLLRRVSATLRANVRREDLVCRAGPASFGVIMAGVGREEALALRARIARAVDEACGAMAASTGGRLALKVSIWEVGSN